MKHTIRRTYMVRKVEVYEVTMPDEEDPQHFIDDHFGRFDEDLTNGVFDATLVSKDTEHLDYDELHLEVVDRESAKVISIRRKDG